MLLEEIKTVDINPTEKYIFVVSFGATEQHGPFLPIGTDTYIQREITERVAEKFPRVIFLPTIPITSSQEHEGFPGTVWLSKETFTSILLDVSHSIEPYARVIVFTSWHGGNLSAIDKFIEAHQNDFQDVRLVHAILDTDETIKKMEEFLGGPIDEHAGNSEISMVLAIKPSLVTLPDKDYPKNVVKNAWSALRLKEVSEDGIADNHPNWVIDKEHGEIAINMASEELATILENL